MLTRNILRKEVIQPQVPYGYLVTTSPQSLNPPWSAAPSEKVGARPSGRSNSHGVTGGVYKARERIHRVMCYAITSDSDFMGSSCRPQSELRHLLEINSL